MVGLGFGDDGSFALSAGGGPISSSDEYETNFSTGSFSLRGNSGETEQKVLWVLVGILIGVLIWRLL